MIIEKPQLRKAALLLHAMHPQDRDWTLGQLGRGEQKLLTGFLDELRALGMPADRDLIIGATRLFTMDAAAPDQTTKAANESKDVSTTSLAALIDRMHQASPRVVAEALRYEPVSLSASLLTIAAWRWRDALLSQLGEVRRRQVENLLADRTRCPDRLALLLLTLLLPRIAQFGSVKDTVGPAYPSTKSDLLHRGIAAIWRRVLTRLAQGRQVEHLEYSARRDRGL